MMTSWMGTLGLRVLLVAGVLGSAVGGAWFVTQGRQPQQGLPTTQSVSDRAQEPAPSAENKSAPLAVADRKTTPKGQSATKTEGKSSSKKKHRRERTEEGRWDSEERERERENSRKPSRTRREREDD